MDLSEPASVGGFFALRTQACAGTADDVPLARIYGGDTGPLQSRVADVAARLGGVETRVAASLAFQGLASRLWSVALAPAALQGRTPDLSPERLHWDPARSAPDDLWLPGPRPSPGNAEPAQQVREAVHERHLVPLVAATREVTRISERLLWGNAASALGGALGQLDRWCRRQAKRSAADRALHITRTLLTHPDLRATGTLHGADFRRLTCCLYYRTPGAGVCADCVFSHPPNTHQEGAS